jgi:hypothetical protein
MRTHALVEQFRFTRSEFLRARSFAVRAPGSTPDLGTVLAAWHESLRSPIDGLIKPRAKNLPATSSDKGTKSDMSTRTSSSG